MKLFTELYVRLDQTNKTNEKVEAMRTYFDHAEKHDAAWALYFLSGRKPRQIVPSKKLRDLALELSGIPEWLFQESRDTVGDSAETMALLLPNIAETDETPLHIVVEDRLLPLRTADESVQKAGVTDAWSRMNYSQRLVYNKLITGAFRVGVSQVLVMRRCISVNGNTRPSSQGKISPSRTVPFGSSRAAFSISGNRSVIRSSPRDQIKTSSFRLITWARMPSHFHSACQSEIEPRSAGATSI